MCFVSSLRHALLSLCVSIKCFILSLHIYLFLSAHVIMHPSCFSFPFTLFAAFINRAHNNVLKKQQQQKLGKKKKNINSISFTYRHRQIEKGSLLTSYLSLILFLFSLISFSSSSFSHSYICFFVPPDALRIMIRALYIHPYSPRNYPQLWMLVNWHAVADSHVGKLASLHFIGLFF